MHGFAQTGFSTRFQLGMGNTGKSVLVNKDVGQAVRHDGSGDRHHGYLRLSRPSPETLDYDTSSKFDSGIGSLHFTLLRLIIFPSSGQKLEEIPQSRHGPC